MIIEWRMETGYVGAEHSGEIEIDDDATEEEIEEIVMDAVLDCISWDWERVDEE